MEVNRTLLVSQIFFRRLIFDCYNIRICKKEKLKDETSKKCVKSMEVKLRSKMSQWPKIPHSYDANIHNCSFSKTRPFATL